MRLVLFQIFEFPSSLHRLLILIKCRSQTVIKSDQFVARPGRFRCRYFDFCDLERLLRNLNRRCHNHIWNNFLLYFGDSFTALVCFRPFGCLSRSNPHFFLLLQLLSPVYFPVIIGYSRRFQIRINSLLSNLRFKHRSERHKQSILPVFVPHVVVALLTVQVSADQFGITFFLQRTESTHCTERTWVILVCLALRVSSRFCEQRYRFHLR